MQRTANPIDMTLMMREELPEKVPRYRFRNVAEIQHLRHHQEHHKTAIGIHRSETLRSGGGGWLHNEGLSCGESHNLLGRLSIIRGGRFPVFLPIRLELLARD